MNTDFEGATITITGGTGSFGSTMVTELLASKAEQIRIFSRDENKQDAMRNSLKHDRLTFNIENARNRKG